MYISQAQNNMTTLATSFHLPIPPNHFPPLAPSREKTDNKMAKKRITTLNP